MIHVYDLATDSDDAAQISDRDIVASDLLAALSGDVEIVDHSTALYDVPIDRLKKLIAELEQMRRLALQGRAYGDAYIMGGPGRAVPVTGRVYSVPGDTTAMGDTDRITPGDQGGGTGDGGGRGQTLRRGGRTLRRGGRTLRRG